MNSNNHVFILAGGVGSRFWPKSRNDFPKQFIDILGIGKSLLQLTYERFLKLCPASNIYIITNKQYKTLVMQQIGGIPVDNILCEPSRNNTAPCVAYAAFKVAALNPEATMVIAPSDHFILHEHIFIEKIEQGLEEAERELSLITLGITPTRPDTGYGYINFNKNGVNGIHRVNHFTEKPSLDKARDFLSSGDYIWNSGIFIWKAKTILMAFKEHAPEIYHLFGQRVDVYNTHEEASFIETNYSQAPNISIDYAIIEKADNVYTIPADFGWSDLGTWVSLYDIAEKNETNNVVSGERLYLQDTENCLIHTPTDKLTVIRGLKDYIIVDDNNVLLIYPKQEEQEIKKITETLKMNIQLIYL